MTYLLGITAFCLSAVAAYYSIAGLAAIFAGAVIPIIVMGSTLEVAKLVVSSWLYRNWSVTPKLLRYYFLSAITVLMLLTSMGIFGFLSKAHVDQNLVSGDVMSKVALIDEQIKIEKETIDANRKIINQLDSQVDQALSRSTTEAGANNSANLRARQAKDRQAAQKEILQAQAKVNKLNTDKAPIAAQVRQVEAEVGPVKYIASLIYGETDVTVLEKAVRFVILLIVFVFDPLAVLMFIALNQDLARRRKTPIPEEIISKQDDELELLNDILNENIQQGLKDIKKGREIEIRPEGNDIEFDGTTLHLKLDEKFEVTDTIIGQKTDTTTGIGKVKFVN